MVPWIPLSLVLILLLTACSDGGPAPSVSAPQELPITNTVPPSEQQVDTPASTATTSRTIPQRDFDPVSYRLEAELVGSGFIDPVFVTYAKDGSARLFVLEKTGRVRLMDGTVFLDISDRVTSPPVGSYDREQGLLGLAFHPSFASNGFFYLHYNDRQAGDHVISRFGIGANGLGDPASEKVLLRVEQPETNFNGGMLLFGADGYLYIGMGTGGTARELQDNSQDLSSLLGKILRIDVNQGDPYAIPSDNPFVNRQGVRPEIWAYGVRNPWRFSFDRETGDLFIGGPGQFRREWVNFQPGGTPAGQNFGWPILEGSLCYEGDSCDRSGLSLPIIEYNTYENGNCVIISGYVYRGTQQEGLRGAFLYGDFCSSRIWAAVPAADDKWVSTEMLGLGTLISSFGEGEDGELYVTDIQNGNVYQLVTTRR